MVLFLQIPSLSFNNCAPFPASFFSHEDACDFPIFLDVENPPIVHWFPFFLPLWIWEQTNLLYFHSRDSVGVLVEVSSWLTTDSASANHFPSRRGRKVLAFQTSFLLRMFQNFTGVLFQGWFQKLSWPF